MGEETCCEETNSEVETCCGEAKVKNSLCEEQIMDMIASETSQLVGVKTTVVVLTLKNGFEIIGTSSCVDPVNYDHSIGTDLARRKALDKVWELEGYKLQCDMANLDRLSQMATQEDCSEEVAQ